MKGWLETTVLEKGLEPTVLKRGGGVGTYNSERELQTCGSGKMKVLNPKFWKGHWNSVQEGGGGGLESTVLEMRLESIVLERGLEPTVLERGL